MASQTPPDRTRPILVFDFDGVISNSVHDSFRTAVNTYISFRPAHRLPLDKPLSTSTETFQFEKDRPELFKGFKDLMPLGSRAEDYYAILMILERNETGGISDQADFNAFNRRIPPAEQLAFHELFYAIRRELQKKNPEDWAALMPLFPGVADALFALAGRFTLAIATAKDRFSVDIQLKGYGIDRLFRPENILDKDFAESKHAHLSKLHELYGVPYDRIHFIDDKVLHLISVKDLGVRSYLALWGFNTPREHEIAEKEGFTLLSLEHLKDLGNGGNL